MLRPLTALRFPAALAVFLWHAPLTRPAALPVSTGYVGVSFFFLLSGFILTYNYRPPFSLRAFYVARFARVYPIHICGMVLAVAALVAFGGPHWTYVHPVVRAYALVLQTFLLQAWASQPDVHFGGNGPAWSLSDEAFFYALFPLAALAFARWFSGHKPLTVFFGAAAVWALLTAILSTVDAAFDQWSVYIFPPLRFGDFLAGMLLGLGFIKIQESRPSIPQDYAQNLHSDKRKLFYFDPMLVEVAAVCLFFAALGLAPFAPQSLRFSAAFMPFSAVLIVVFAMQRGAISNVLSQPFFVRLGEASYAFYVVHLTVIIVVQHFLPAAPVAAFFLALILSTALSLALFTYVETPLRRRIRATFQPQTQSPTHLPQHTSAQTILRS